VASFTSPPLYPQSQPGRFQGVKVSCSCRNSNHVSSGVLPAALSFYRLSYNGSLLWTWMEIINVFIRWNMGCYFTYLLLLQRFLSEQMGTFEGTANDKSSPARLSPFFLQTVHSSFLVLPIVWKCILPLLAEPSFIHNVHLNSSNLFPSVLSSWWFVLLRGIPFVLRSAVFRSGFISDHRNWLVLT